MATVEECILSGTPEGIKHKQIDYSGVFADPEAFKSASEYMFQMFEREVFDVIMSVDTAGTTFASSVALKMGIPFATVGLSDSMMREMDSETIETHHGSKIYRLPVGSVKPGQKVVIILDNLSHGKDVSAAVNLIRRQGGTVTKIGTFLEHSVFNARKKLLKGIPVECMLLSEDL